MNRTQQDHGSAAPDQAEADFGALLRAIRARANAPAAERTCVVVLGSPREDGGNFTFASLCYSRCGCSESRER